MKFKDDNTYTEQSRSLTRTDADGDTLEVCVFSDNDSLKVVFYVNGEAFGCSRKKARKIAWALMDELNASDTTEF